MTLNSIIIYGVLGVVLYYLTVLLFDFLLRGFAPFFSSQPWIVKQIEAGLGKIKLNNESSLSVISFGSGKSGFLRHIEKTRKTKKLIGAEKFLFNFLFSWLQVFVRRSKIKVIKSRHFHRVYVRDIDLIYCYVPQPSTIRELGDKFKFECRSGTIIISNGFSVPFLDPIEIIELNEPNTRFSFLSHERKIWFAKSKRWRKEAKVFIYRI